MHLKTHPSTLLSLLLLLCTTFTSITALSAKEEEAYKNAERQLTFIEPKEFAEKTGKGAWLVFFGNKDCKHCKLFTPTWLEAQQKVDEMKNEFHLGKVECTGRAANEDLCMDQKIEYYPTVKLYHNGKYIEQPEDIREIGKLLAYIKMKSNELLPGDEPQPVVEAQMPKEASNIGDAKAKTGADEKKSTEEKTGRLVVQQRQSKDSKSLEDAIAELQEVAAAGTKPQKHINPNGRVIELTDKTFDIMTNNTPWFIMFHAPWCPHCKKLKPIFEDLAPAMTGLVNIAEVDCTKEGGLCRKHGVRGYPTLKFMQAPAPAVEYKGSRTFDALRDYALSFSAKVPFKVVRSEELSRILKKEEVAFFFYYDPRTMERDALDAFVTVSTSLRSEATFYITPDPVSKSLLQIPEAFTGPHLISAKDNGETITSHTGPYTNSLASRQYMSRFILDNRHPRILHLDAINQEEILGGDKLVVIAILDPSQSSKKKIFNVLRDASRLWRDRDQSSGMKDLLIFSWLDGVKWEAYISRVYGLTKEQLPVLIVVDPKEDKYWDVDKGGRAIAVEKESVVRVVEEVLEGVVPPKYTTGFLGRLAYKTGKHVSDFVDWIYENFIFMLCVGALMFLVYMVGGVPGFRKGRAGPKAE